jgi:hypothetical protein
VVSRWTVYVCLTQQVKLTQRKWPVFQLKNISWRNNTLDNRRSSLYDSGRVSREIVIVEQRHLAARTGAVGSFIS